MADAERTRAAAMLRRIGQTARLMIGLPDYDGYRAHMASHHPDARPMTRAEFVAERQAARYGRGGSRCC